MFQTLVNYGMNLTYPGTHHGSYEWYAKYESFIAFATLKMNRDQRPDLYGYV